MVVREGMLRSKPHLKQIIIVSLGADENAHNPNSNDNDNRNNDDRHIPVPYSLSQKPTISLHPCISPSTTKIQLHNMNMQKAANHIADNWGKALTKLTKEKDVEPLKALCEPIVELVLATTSDDGTAVFTIGDEGAHVSWEECRDLVTQDAGDDYKETDSASMGMLGNRMILETARIDNKDEIYMNACAIVTMSTSTGKVAKLEVFTDSISPSLLDAGVLAASA